MKAQSKTIGMAIGVVLIIAIFTGVVLSSRGQAILSEISGNSEGGAALSLANTEEQKMSYDYQNCINYAVETAVEAAVKTATEKALSEGEEKGKAEGLAEGEEKGKNKARCETARNMLHDNTPVDLISKYTGLTKEQILKLKSE